MSRRVFVLAVLVAAVGGWLLLREIPGMNRQEREQASELRLFDIDPAKVEVLKFTGQDHEIRIARRGEEWWIESPIVEPAVEFTVRSSIEQFTSAERWRLVAKGVEGADWGLYGLAEDSPARVRVELMDGEGHSAGVDFGLLTSGSRTAWVRRVGGDDLELVLEELFNLAKASHHGYREVALFHVVSKELASLRFTNGSRSWGVVRDAEGLWYLDREGRPRLRRWVVEEQAFTVTGMLVDGYLRDGLEESDWAAYGLDHPWGSAHWEATDGRTGTVWLGNQVENGIYFGRREGLDTVFRIAGTIEPILELDPETLLDTNPIGGNFLHLASARVGHGDGWVEVSREELGVSLAADSGEVDHDEYAEVTGRNLLLGLEEFQPLAEMSVAAGRSPRELFDPEEARILLHWPEREVSLTIGQIDGKVWLGIDGEARLWQVRPDLLLRTRQVLALRP